MQLETGTIVDRYAVEGLLGQGGMAMVYRVRHQQLGTCHALKVLLLPARSIRERLLQEGRVQARLRHPNIVNVTDLVEIDGAPGLVMEYIPGPSLDDLLRQCELSVDQVDLLARGILDGVAAAHEVGLIHRDLKPGNVLIEVRKDHLLPKITDFGLAKLVGDEGSASKTRSGLAMGTPCYMAPEQVRDAKGVDERADVFSLGAVLYELITGRRAFDGDDTFEIFSAVTSGRFTPIRELVPDAPDRMVAAVAAALQTDRESRVQSVEALAELWVAGTPAPLAAVAFAPALLQRAEELGSGADNTPMSWSPSSGSEVSKAPSVGGGTAVPGGGSATMDWSLDAADGPAPGSAPSIAPPDPEPPRPQPQPQQSSNRDPTIRRAILGLGAFVSFGLVGLFTVGVVGGGVLLTARAPMEEAELAAAPSKTTGAKTGSGGDAAEVGPPAIEAGDAVADAADLDEPEDPLDERSVARPPPPPPEPVAGKEDARSVDEAPKPDSEEIADPGLAEPEADPTAEAPPAEDEVGSADEGAGSADEQAADAPTGRVEVAFMLHPMTRGASAIGEAWLVGPDGRHALPATVVAGEYQIEASFNAKDPVDVGSLTVPADGTLQLACFNATKSCREE